MTNQIQVSITGLTGDASFEKYQQYIEKLNCKYAKKMTQTTQLLIVGCTATQKYKKAKLSRQPISCVTVNWLLQSLQSIKKKKKILPFSDFPVDKIFYGVHVCIFGFNQQETQVLKKVLIENGAHVKNIPNIGQLVNFDQDEGQYYDCAIMIKRQFQRLANNAVASIKTPIVGIQWVQKSLEKKMCKWPKDYALNYQYLLKHEPKNLSMQIPKLTNQLKLFLEKDLNDTQFEFLTKVKIFIDQSIHFKLSNIMKKIVCACGGLYLNHFSSMVTHVIVSSIDQISYLKYLKHGNIIKIVRAEWLIDSIHLFRKMDEQDYLIRQFSSKYTMMGGTQSQNHYIQQGQSYYTSPLLGNGSGNGSGSNNNVMTNGFNGINLSISSQNALNALYGNKSFNLAFSNVSNQDQQQNTNNLNDFSVNYNANNKNSQKQSEIKKINPITKQPSRQSISIDLLTRLGKDNKSQKKEVITALYKSQIFRDKNFYIDNSQKKETQMLHLGTKIRQNGGIIWDSNKGRDKQFFIVLKDSQENPKILQKLGKYKANEIPVSYRWINHCINHQTFVNPSAKHHYIFKPLSMMTPNKQFHSLKIQILGKDDSHRKRLIQLLQVLGSHTSITKKSDLTHCICLDNDFKILQKYKDIKNVNDKVLFLRIDWIFQCIKQKKIVDKQEFECVQE